MARRRKIPPREAERIAEQERRMNAVTAAAFKKQESARRIDERPASPLPAAAKPDDGTAGAR